MARHKTVKGICRLCGELTDLTFEHVPPRSAHNKNTKYKSVDFDEYIKVKNPLIDKPKGRIKQGGVGFNAFCGSCNSFLGANYVPAYKRWVDGGFEILKNSEYYIHEFEINDIEPLKIFKQIISMFLAINGEDYFEWHPELAAFVKQPTSKLLSSRYRVFSYLTRAEKMRYLGHISKGNLLSGTMIHCSEISYPPYGYVLTVDYEGSLKTLNEITDFKNIDKSTSLNMTMCQLPTWVSLSPLDYRSQADIKKGIEGNLNQKQ